MTLEHWFALFATCIALAVSPGPSSTYALTTSIRSGQGAGLRAVMGSTLGFAALILTALVGLTAFLADKPWTLITLKGLGATYLLWLSYSLWQHTESANDKPMPDAPKRVSGNTFLRGFLIALSNPKIVLFWLAFMPSIMPLDQLSATDVVLVMLTFAIVEACAELSLVWMGAKAQRFLARHVQLIDQGSAIIFVGFALLIVTSGA